MVTYYYDFTGNANSDDEMEGDIEEFLEQTPRKGKRIALPIKVPVAKGTWKGKKKKGGK